MNKYNIEEVNKDLYATIEQDLHNPINELIAWSVFGDSDILKSGGAFFYLSYNTLELDTDLIKTEHLKLMNDIEQRINDYIKNNAHNVDFSTLKSSQTTTNDLIKEFIQSEHEELNFLISEGESVLIYMAALIITYREASLFAFNNSHYYLAIQFQELCKSLYLKMILKNIEFVKNFKKEQTFKAQAKAKTRWSEHNETRPKKKKQYLQIMRDNKFTTFSETATYIKQHIDKGKKPSHDTVCRWLSQANRADFS